MSLSVFKEKILSKKTDLPFLVDIFFRNKNYLAILSIPIINGPYKMGNLLEYINNRLLED